MLGQALGPPCPMAHRSDAVWLPAVVLSAPFPASSSPSPSVPTPRPACCKRPQATWRGLEVGHQEERERERRQGARRVREGTIPGDQPPDDSSQSLLNGNRERHLPTPGTRTIINCCSKLLMLGGGLVDVAVDTRTRQTAWTR